MSPPSAVAAPVSRPITGTPAFSTSAARNAGSSRRAGLTIRRPLPPPCGGDRGLARGGGFAHPQPDPPPPGDKAGVVGKARVAPPPRGARHDALDTKPVEHRHERRVLAQQGVAVGPAPAGAGEVA